MPLNLSWQDVALRLALTMVAAGLIGVNRSIRGRAAGLRTMVLIGLASAVAMIQANLLLPLAGKTSASFAVMDLMRLPLGILTGVGFIGGGAILKRGDLVTGVTTAAAIWLMSVIGLCFGGGQHGVGSGRATDQAIDSRRHVRRRHQMRGAAAQKAFVAAVFKFAEGKARQQHTVEETAQTGRADAPPGGIDEDQMIGPGDERARLLQVRFQLLLCWRGRVDIRIELERAEIQPFDLTPCRSGAVGVGCGKRGAKARWTRMAKDDENLQGTTFGEASPFRGDHVGRTRH